MIEGVVMELHPEYILKNGRRASVLLPYREFKALQEKLRDIEDLHALDAAKKKEGHKKTIPLARVRKELGL